MANRRLVWVTAMLGIVGGCGDRMTSPPEAGPDPAFARGMGIDESYLRGHMDAINAQLASSGAGYAVVRAELSLTPEADAASPIVVFTSDHNLRLPTRWVAGDARRGATGNGLTWGNFAPFMVANGAGVAESAVDAAFGTWSSVACSNLDLSEVSLAANNFPSAILTLGGFVNDPLEADVSTPGFLPGAVFDAFVGPGASQNVLGVTFTFVWIDGNGDPTDVDNNRLADTALKEIWYNNAFQWSTSGGGVDVETVALHEEGHAFELDHFGQISGNFKIGKLIVSPRAVMNAVILGTLRAPLGTDNGAFCGYWASWPD